MGFPCSLQSRCFIVLCQQLGTLKFIGIRSKQLFLFIERSRVSEFRSPLSQSLRLFVIVSSNDQLSREGSKEVISSGSPGPMQPQPTNIDNHRNFLPRLTMERSHGRPSAFCCNKTGHLKIHSTNPYLFCLSKDRFGKLLQFRAGVATRTCVCLIAVMICETPGALPK